MKSKPQWRLAARLAWLLAATSTLIAPAQAQEIVLPFSSGVQLKKHDMRAAALNKAQATGVRMGNREPAMRHCMYEKGNIA